MKTVSVGVKVKAGKSVVEQKVVAKSFFLQDRELSRIGAEKVCSCGKSFVIGEAELFKFSHDVKGTPLNKIEVCGISGQNEFFLDVNLKLNPELQALQGADKAIIFGVEYLNMHLCPECTAENSTYPEATAGTSSGGERSAYGSGEVESN
jgi:hypothetical protein